MNRPRRPTRFPLKPIAIALMSAGIAGTALGGPQDGVVRAGVASITTSGPQTRIQQSTDRAVIDWRSFGTGATEQVLFQQPGVLSATLNRVTGDQVSVLLGRLDANGRVLLVNPNGIVIGSGAQINVGSLIASTSNVSTANFMAGRLQFDQPGKPGAEIVNSGTITAAEGGLIALVAPHVRNDGLIQARLGKVVLGAADTFTIDLYGDELVSLALSDVHAGAIAQSGTIDVGGGRAVLVTAASAKNVLDNVINMSGSIKADSAVAQGGKIFLLAEGGSVDVSGTLTANGATGGGTIHVGGGFQGAGAYRALNTNVSAGATLKANATGHGNGGEVVVWSDASTVFAGEIQAKGGPAGGNGGRMEVSSKGTLAFLGTADASAPAGAAGSLLLDPAILDIGLAEAGLISRVLRTGTSTTLAADIDINVNSLIDGRGRIAGGGLTMTAGNNINVNDFVITNSGSINLFATAGTVNVAAGKAVFGGAAPITVQTGGTLHTGPFLTGAMLSLTSTAGAVAVDSFIDGGTGRVDISAAADVNINQPIVNLASGSPLNVSAGNDINVNAQVDGRGGAAGGAASFVASRNVNVNDFVVTNNGAISVTATNGAATVAAGKGLFSGTAPISMTAKGNVTSGVSSSGSLALTSSAGAVAVNGLIDGATGAAAISAATDVNINQPVLNMASGSALNVSAANDINVNAQIDGRGGVAGGNVSLTAARNVAVNDFIVTNNGAIGITATNGTATIAAAKGLFAGTSPVTVNAKGNLSSGSLSAGTVVLASSAGAVALNGIVDASTGRVDVNAATDVSINQPVLNMVSGNPLNVTAGQDINVNAQIDGRGGVAGGSVALTAARNVQINDFIVTNNGPIDVTATNGTASVAAGKGLLSGTAPISMHAKGNLTTGASSSGSLTLASSAGAVTIAGLIDGNTKTVNISAATDVNVNQPILNMATGNPLNVTAGQDINVNAQIDGRGGVTGGAATLTATRNVALNESIVTNDGGISVTASTGAVTVAAGRGLFAGSAPISVSAAGNITNGAVSAGTLTLASSAGAVALNGVIDASTGLVNVNAGTDVNINQPVLNLRTGKPLNITAGQDINVNVQLDGRGGVAGGVLTLDAGRNVNANQDIATENGAISITAHTGTVTTAPGMGLFAGSGPIAMTSGGTLSTGLLSTTGTLSVQSTGGSLNVNAPIDASTGAITLTAAGAVNLNQPLANPRTNAPLSVTAGTDINVNAPIDVRDATPQNPSGTVTLQAGQNVNLNQDVVTNNAAIGVVAQTGTLVTAATKGLYSGSAPISVSAGGTLSTGIVSTTGSLSLASTAGGVNVNTPIADTTGAVTITAAGAVNVNQPITNIKTGSPLLITAGADLNVNAQIDGRSGTAAGGSVTLSAGNNLRLFDNIVTNDGAINLTTIAGSVFLAPVSQDANLLLLAPPKQVRAGNAPITIVSGGDFSTGAPPPQPIPTPPPSVTTTDEAKDYVREFLKQYVQLVTTGALNITSTNGNVNVIAPIPDTTGPVTITAGNAINVKHKINSDSQPIVLNGGTGGINVFAVNDGCAASFLCNRTSPVDARAANLTLNSLGDVTITSDGVASAKTLTIDTRARIVTGSIGSTSDLARPSEVVLIADQGIVNFYTGKAGDVSATSIGGSINLGVFLPNKLRITTGTPDPNNPTAATDCTSCNINTGGFLGPDVVLNAGGSVNLSPIFLTGALTAIARAGDVNLNQTVIDNVLTISAGRDVKLNAGGCSTIDFGVLCGLVWVGPNPNSGAASGPLSMTAGRDILTDAFSPIHISNGQALTLTAGRNLTLNLLETLGPVSLSATTGSIVLQNDIGAHIVNGTGGPDFNPSDLGVASLVMSAPAPTGAITMQGARAEGNVTITAGGNLTAAKQITSVGGAVTITTGGNQTLSAVPIGTLGQLEYPPIVLGVVAPGPSVPPPLAPGIASVPGAGLPLLAEIAVVDQPSLSGGSAAAPGASADSVALPTAPTGAGGPASVGQTAALPGGASGTSIGLPGGSGEEGVDTTAAQRAAQFGATGEETAPGDAALVALSDSEVLCPPGVALGSPIKKKDANGKEVTVKCK